jgi:hypothetical protein
MLTEHSIGELGSGAWVLPTLACDRNGFAAGSAQYIYYWSLIHDNQDFD